MKHSNKSPESRRPVQTFGQSPLVAMKRAAMRSSASARGEPVRDVREAYGFFPSGVEAAVLKWPKL